MIVNILYSAPPDGDDASSTFASRASDHCTRDGITIGYVERPARLAESLSLGFRIAKGHFIVACIIINFSFYRPVYM